MSSTQSTVELKECLDALAWCGVPPAEALGIYMQLLLEWNQKINVTGARDPKELALKHIADVWGALNVLGNPSTKVMDIGSGGGIPGIILGIVCPDSDVTLVERRQKKAGILSSMISQLELDRRIKVVSRSFEEIHNLNEGTEYWFRGFLPGPKLAVYLSEFFPRADLGQLVLMKGPGWPQEKLDIMGQQKIRAGWRERFASAAELSYTLPHGAGERLLVLV